MALAGVPLVILLTWLLTLCMRRYALGSQLLDVPNARSSHLVPTPRGGGVAVVAVFIACLVWLSALGGLSASVAGGMAGSGALVALVGFLDDRGHLAARWRLLAHGVAVIWLLFWLGGLPALEWPWLGRVDLGWAGTLLLAVGLVWLLNLYNFMDGIDGIAGVEAVSVCLVMAWLAVDLPDPLAAWLPLLLGAAVLGFLLLNFPPAKIFMGDAGSGFLGLMLGALLVWHARLEADLFWAWAIMLGVFVVDASFTLMRRLLRGERVYEAHRSHAYQFAARRYAAHRPVTLAVLLINLIWLWPWAWAASTGRLSGILALLIAYVPLVGLALYFHAGIREP